MSSKVTLIVLAKGRFEDKHCVFEKPAHGFVGRHNDCLIEFPDADEFSEISRHHCELDIAPPKVRVRDVGSRNGTFINGQLIGQRDETLEPEDVNWSAFVYRDLKDGDCLCLATTLLKVMISNFQEDKLQPQVTGSTATGTVAEGRETISDLGAVVEKPAQPAPMKHLAGPIPQITS